MRVYVAGELKSLGDEIMNEYGIGVRVGNAEYKHNSGKSTGLEACVISMSPPLVTLLSLSALPRESSSCSRRALGVDCSFVI